MLYYTLYGVYNLLVCCSCFLNLTSILVSEDVNLSCPYSQKYYSSRVPRKEAHHVTKCSSDFFHHFHLNASMVIIKNSFNSDNIMADRLFDRDEDPSGLKLINSVFRGAQFWLLPAPHRQTHLAVTWLFTHTMVTGVIWLFKTILYIK